MAEEKSWSQRSMEEAAQRKRDYEYSARTGAEGISSASHEGAQAYRARKRQREALDRMVASSSQPLPPTDFRGDRHADRAYGAFSTPTVGQKIQAWLEFIPQRVPRWLYWTTGLFVALAGYGYGIANGQTQEMAAITGLLVVGAVALAAKTALWLMGVTVVLTEVAIKIGFFLAALYFGFQWLQSSGVL